MTGTPVDPYFKTGGIERAALSWAVATRVQLDRWATYASLNLLGRLWGADTPLDGVALWQLQFEHHFAVLAADHMLMAIDRLDPPIPVEQSLSEGIADLRDMLEHWLDNMPVFNQHPRPRQPAHRSGKRFAQNHPDRSPYNWLAWDSGVGPRLSTTVTANEVRALTYEVEARIVGDDPTYADYVPPPRAESPWSVEPSGYWPRRVDS